MSSEEGYIREAIALAVSAQAHGNHPFGALLVSNCTGEIILRAENTVTTARDPTCHTEMNLCRAAWKALSEEDIHNATLYTSTEPCPMCCGAIFW
jgi:tRNA(Arg) A34 adenosine deaminase TadA